MQEVNKVVVNDLNITPSYLSAPFIVNAEIELWIEMLHGRENLTCILIIMSKNEWNLNTRISSQS